jgi:hypothetical protein
MQMLARPSISICLSIIPVIIFKPLTLHLKSQSSTGMTSVLCGLALNLFPEIIQNLLHSIDSLVHLLVLSTQHDNNIKILSTVRSLPQACDIR